MVRRVRYGKEGGYVMVRRVRYGKEGNKKVLSLTSISVLY